MRCYFKRSGRITAVEILTKTGDDERIAEAHALFAAKGKLSGADGFEVWDGPRLLYHFPQKTPQPAP